MVDPYLKVASETANLGSLVIFFAFVLVIGLGLVVHQMKNNTMMLNNLINSLTEANAAMIPQLAKLNESYERAMEILRQFDFSLERNEKNVFVLQEKVSTLKDEMFQLERLVAETQKKINDRDAKFKKIDDDINNILDVLHERND